MMYQRKIFDKYEPHAYIARLKWKKITYKIVHEKKSITCYKT